MNIYLICVLAGMALAVASFAGGYYEGMKSVKKERAEQEYNALVELSGQLNTLREAKDENIAKIDELQRIARSAERVRMPAPKCKDGLVYVQGDSSGTGELYTSVLGRTEDAINAYDATYRDEAARADKTVESCRVAVDFLAVKNSGTVTH